MLSHGWFILLLGVVVGFVIGAQRWRPWWASRPRFLEGCLPDDAAERLSALRRWQAEAVEWRDRLAGEIEAVDPWADISERMDEHERLKAAAHEELRRRMVG